MVDCNTQAQKTKFFKRRESAEKWKKDNEQFFSNGMSDTWITIEELLD